MDIIKKRLLIARILRALSVSKKEKYKQLEEELNDIIKELKKDKEKK